MTRIALLLTGIGFLCSCSSQQGTPHESAATPALVGTWKLITGMTIAGKDTTVTDYTKGQEMIKIINPTHFAFLHHDLNQGKDSAAVFAAGGGRVAFDSTHYTEYLDYCNLREWEKHQFDLTYTISGDTLRTTGLEKVENAGVDRINIETLVRVK